MTRRTSVSRTAEGQTHLCNRSAKKKPPRFRHSRCPHGSHQLLDGMPSRAGTRASIADGPEQERKRGARTSEEGANGRCVGASSSSSTSTPSSSSCSPASSRPCCGWSTSSHADSPSPRTSSCGAPADIAAWPAEVSELEDSPARQQGGTEEARSSNCKYAFEWDRKTPQPAGEFGSRCATT